MSNTEKLMMVGQKYKIFLEAEERYLSLKASAERMTSVYGGNGVKNCNTRSREDLMLSLAEAENWYIHAVDMYISAYASAIRLLSCADIDFNQHQILHKRFIEFKQWKTIEAETDQTYRNCMKVYKKALEHIEK